MQLATIDEFYAYHGLALPELDEAQTLALNSLLTRATSRILRLTRFARYAVVAGVPSPAYVREAFRDAVSAQAGAMRRGAEEGLEPSEDWTSISLIGVEFSRKDSAADDGIVVIGGTRYSAEAIDALVAAGLSSVVAHPGA
jgi:hypothetical protein